MTTEQTVDKVLDGIDIEGVADELLKQFIITTRS